MHGITAGTRILSPRDRVSIRPCGEERGTTSTQRGREDKSCRNYLKRPRGADPALVPPTGTIAGGRSPLEGKEQEGRSWP